MSYAPLDHHFTGPITAQGSEGEGSVFHVEGCVLYTLARTLGGPVLELGADLGISTRYIHEGLEAHDYTNVVRSLEIDPSDDVVYAWDYNHKWDDDPDWPRRIRCTADTLCRSIRSKIPNLSWKWAFVDADHRYGAVLNDLFLVTKVLRIPLIVFHDCNPNLRSSENPSCGSDAYWAVTENMPSDYDYELLGTPAGLLIAKLKEQA